MYIYIYIYICISLYYTSQLAGGGSGQPIGNYDILLLLLLIIINNIHINEQLHITTTIIINIIIIAAGLDNSNVYHISRLATARQTET